MDLLGNIGNEDQLISAREENRVLQAKVKELTVRVHELLAENQALKAEVELYREECALPSFSKLTLSDGGGENEDTGKMDLDGSGPPDDFVTSGNGLFPDDPAVTLPKIHGSSNPLCCALHPNDSLLATGGADSSLNLCRWGLALSPSEDSASKAVTESIKIPCVAPVICTSFSQENQGRTLPAVAAGCMDGSVLLAHCGADKDARNRILKSETGNKIKHDKYVKTVCWSPSAPILASASADGTLQLTRINHTETNFDNSGIVTMEILKSMHFDGPVETMCFLNNGDAICCYVRGTSYLSYFDLKDGCKQTKITLNGGSTGTGGFDDHVSFAVLSLLPSPNNGDKYLAAATDTSRNIILETGSARIVRNLYGHSNDGFSNPKVGWSSSGQYLYGNTQDENSLCVWDIASSSIVKRLGEGVGGHSGLVRDIYSSSNTDTIATVSFDKTAKVWLRGL